MIFFTVEKVFFLFVCVRACARVRVCVCVCVCVCANVYACVYATLVTLLCVRVTPSVHACVCVWVWVWVWDHCGCLRMWPSTYNACIHHMYVCIYIYIYIQYIIYNMMRVHHTVHVPQLVHVCCHSNIITNMMVSLPVIRLVRTLRTLIIMPIDYNISKIRTHTQTVSEPITSRRSFKTLCSVCTTVCPLFKTICLI